MYGYDLTNMADAEDDISQQDLRKKMTKFVRVVMMANVQFISIVESFLELGESRLLRTLMLSKCKNEQAMLQLRAFLRNTYEVPSSFLQLFTSLCSASVKIETNHMFRPNQDSVIVVNVKPERTACLRRITKQSAETMARQLLRDIDTSASTFNSSSAVNSNSSNIKVNITEEFKEQLTRCMVEYYHVLKEGARRHNTTISPYVKYRREDKS